ncbi:hypothetical protein AB0M86_48800, partial [Streptomyces sp. NPDC051639]|uniref:hypothetical protein n=1 Tax=Streptomyces sp. NPDC051639 TaxID=3155671 RepID=UPI0034232B9D
STGWPMCSMRRGCRGPSTAGTWTAASAGTWTAASAMAAAAERIAEAADADRPAAARLLAPRLAEGVRDR